MVSTETKSGGRHPGGRPPKYRKEFCAAVEQGLSEGYSLDGCAGILGVCRRVINDWQAAYPEFLQAVSRGKAKQALYWETEAKRIVKTGGGPGTASTLALMLRNSAPGSYSAERRASVKLPSVDSPQAALAAISEALAAFARGDVDDRHAEAIVAMAKAYLGAEEITLLAERIAALEAARTKS